MTLREQIAAAASRVLGGHNVALIDAILPIAEAALQAEQEACAKIVEAGYVGHRVETDFGDEIRKKAAAIRARAEEEPHPLP